MKDDKNKIYCCPAEMYDKKAFEERYQNALETFEKQLKDKMNDPLAIQRYREQAKRYLKDN